MQLHPEICHESTKKDSGINNISLNAVKNKNEIGAAVCTCNT